MGRYKVCKRNHARRNSKIERIDINRLSDNLPRNLGQSSSQENLNFENPDHYVFETTASNLRRESADNTAHGSKPSTTSLYSYRITNPALSFSPRSVT